MKTPLGTSTRGGFTLVEALVVVAVVALLLGLLLPALGAARGASRATACAAHLRQLVVANDTYASDHHDRYAPGAPDIASSNRLRWHGSRPAPNATFRPEGGTLSDYLADSAPISVALRACPAWIHPAPDAPASLAFERSAGGYGYNNAFVGTQRRARSAFGQRTWHVESDRTGARRSSFRGPSGTAAFADSALAADMLIEYSFIEPPLWPEHPSSRPDPSTHFRHAPGSTTGPAPATGRANVAWLDGHVSAESMTHSESSGVYALDARDHRVGWFGHAHSNRDFEP